MRVTPPLARGVQDEDHNQTRSTLVTSQFPIDTWPEVVGSPTLADAIIERILTRAHRLELRGKSIRPLTLGQSAKEAES